MQFETIDYHSARAVRTEPAAATTAPFETERPARANVAEVYADCAQSSQRGVLGEANLAYLREACDQAGVALGAFVAGPITRKYAAGLSAADSTRPPSEQRGQHTRRPR